jgi:hypothetical protein
VPEVEAKKPLPSQIHPFKNSAVTHFSVTTIIMSHPPRRILAALLFVCFTPSFVMTAEDHPATAAAQRYVKVLLAQDWTACADMILPDALSRKHQSTMALVRASGTITEENEKLRSLGLADLKELEAMTPRAYFILERRRMSEAMNRSQEARDEELKSLTMEPVSTGTEEGGKFAHVLLRTHRVSGGSRVHELMLISLYQDAADKTKWLVVPDTLMPVAEPLEAAKEK